MSKERLEEIENKLIRWRTEELESTIVDFWPKDIRDVEWLIEQAKRVQDLESVLRSMKTHYENFNKELNNEKYICHQKCQEVVSVNEVKHLLFPFEWEGEE